MFRVATLPALAAILLIIPFRVPRNWVEVAAVPAVVTVIGIAWMQAGAWAVSDVKASGASGLKSALGSKSIAYALGALLILLLLLVIFLPAIASTGAARRFALGKVNQSLNGRVDIADWSIGWFGGIDVKGIKVMDPAAFRSHFGTEPPDISQDASQGARLAALVARYPDMRPGALELRLDVDRAERKTSPIDGDDGVGVGTLRRGNQDRVVQVGLVALILTHAIPPETSAFQRSYAARRLTRRDWRNW